MRFSFPQLLTVTIYQHTFLCEQLATFDSASLVAVVNFSLPVYLYALKCIRKFQGQESPGLRHFGDRVLQ